MARRAHILPDRQTGRWTPHRKFCVAILQFCRAKNPTVNTLWRRPPRPPSIRKNPP